ncbi:MAG: iron-sulfur cluster insertion protein ErpA [Arsenophonus sp.]|nr:MAG: iron-sulfur cluster insertion protein ErpA [Arsenophonus sp.]
MINKNQVSIKFTDTAANKIKLLIKDNKNPNLHFRVYIIGGGCSGFKYGFVFDDKIEKGDFKIKNKGVELIIDPMSFQYILGGCVDYVEGLEGSKFVVVNPNAKITCGCGSSFSI